MSAWIDFRELRSSLKFEDVLRHYGIEINRRGDQHHGVCPLPTHGSNEQSRPFSANLAKGVFNCFGCKASGNVLDFAALMEGVDIQDGPAFRGVAVKLRDTFCAESDNTAKSTGRRRRHIAEQAVMRLDEADKSAVEVNAPLDFALKQLDPKHSYLDRRGFSLETIQHFGLGYCAKGFLAGRVAIPLHDEKGGLIGYAGRLADGNRPNEQNPKYLFPGTRERKGVVHEFKKSLVLYNSHRLTSPAREVIVVQGFPSVWWLTQMGIPEAVSVMGKTMSDEQAALLLRLIPPTGRIWLMPDGNEAGEAFVRSSLDQLVSERFVRVLKLDAGKKPTDYPGGYLKQRLGR